MTFRRAGAEWRVGALAPLLAAEEAAELSWQDRALCAETDPEAFFPEKGGSTRDAKRVCRACEVRSECLEYALANDERFGIYGGLSPMERRRLKRRTQFQSAPEEELEMIPDLTDAEVARFRSKLIPGGCGVRWSGELNRHGYGRFTIYRDRGRKRIRILAHRLAYKLETGDDPGELVVRHQCDTPACCTPSCFLLGTQGDNIRDAVSRGRMNTAALAAHRQVRDQQAQARIVTGVKTCSRCRESKPLASFFVANANVDGRAYWCKSCMSEHQASRKAVA